MFTFLNFIFYFSIFFLVVISLFPGSLLGLLLYGNLAMQPNLIDNPFGTAINHFIYYFYVSALGIFIKLKNKDFQKMILGLLLLAIILEVFQFIVPNRAFQLYDLLGNLAGVLVAYFLVKIYLVFNKV